MKKPPGNDGLPDRAVSRESSSHCLQGFYSEILDTLNLIPSATLSQHIYDVFHHKYVNAEHIYDVAGCVHIFIRSGVGLLVY